jgi:hypothetical protein
MKVIVELSLQGDDGVGMGNPKTHVTQELSIEEWTRGGVSSSEEYLRVRDTLTNEHLFDIRIGGKGQVYMEIPKGDLSNDIITIRGEQ